MFFSKKKKRKRFLCLRILCFFGIKDYSVTPKIVTSYYLNTKRNFICDYRHQ